MQGFDEGLVVVSTSFYLYNLRLCMWQLTVVRRLSGGLENVTRYTFEAGSLTVTLPESPMGTSKRVGLCFAIFIGVHRPGVRSRRIGIKLDGGGCNGLGLLIQQVAGDEPHVFRL